MSFCLDTYLQQSDNYEILASQAGFKDCADLSDINLQKSFNVNAGEEILGSRVIGITPIPIGVDSIKGTVLIPYTKPCYGTAVVELPVDIGEIEKIRKLNIK